MGEVSREHRRLLPLFRRAEALWLSDAVLAAEGSHLDAGGARAELARTSFDGALAERYEALLAADRAGEARARYVERWGVVGVRRFRSAGGADVTLLPVETFPGHVNNVYLVASGAHFALFDCGSGSASSVRDLALGFSVLASHFGEPRGLSDVTEALISHAHLDHYGGSAHLRASSRAALLVHELDARVLTLFEERHALACRDMDRYWSAAGVVERERQGLRELYGRSRALYRSQPVDAVLRDGDRVGAGWVAHHVPGHCPGLVCLQVDDLLLTSDHVLSRITPLQVPQAVVPMGGLALYLSSLRKIATVPGIVLALGGHEEPIADLYGRCAEIVEFHRARLARVARELERPSTVDAVAKALFGEREGYDRILALDEAGAHVEHLHQHGRIAIANVSEVARDATAAVVYRALP